MSRNTTLEIGAVVAVLGGLGFEAQAQTTYTVDPGQNIQAVINGASDGDVIELNPGEYQQIIDLTGVALTVRSTDAEDPAVVAGTILNGVGLNTVVRITGSASSGTSIEGLTIIGGSAANGGGLHVSAAGSVGVHDCVIEGNVSSGSGAGVYSNASNLTFTGTTFRLNETTGGGADGGGHYGNGGTHLIGGANVRHSLVEFGYAGTGNVSDDPAFLDAAGGELALMAGSPAIDAGDTTAYCGPMVDLAGATRGVDAPEADTGVAVMGPVIDMGAFEFQVDAGPSGCAADLDGSGAVDFADLILVLGTWGMCP